MQCCAPGLGCVPGRGEGTSAPSSKGGCARWPALRAASVAFSFSHSPAKRAERADTRVGPNDRGAHAVAPVAGDGKVGTELTAGSEAILSMGGRGEGVWPRCRCRRCACLRGR